MNEPPVAGAADIGLAMIILVLVRHAKSDWNNPALSDHDRPLNGRGERDAPRMAGQLAETGFQPDAILSSTALRARTTANALSSALDVAVTLAPGLYGASARELLAHAVTVGVQSIVLVAHDPGMTDLAAELSGGGISHMPTSAVATFTWETDDWDDASSLTPQSWNLATPR